jgi:hypothetical protein
VEEQGESKEDEWDVRRRRKRWCAHDVKHPRGRGIATARVGVGLVSGEYGEEAPAPMPSAENGVARRWRHEGREKRSRMANEVVATEGGPSLSCGGIYDQMGRVWRAGPRHDPFNSAWANPARASCSTWAVASARPGTIIFFKKNHIYICTIYIQYYKHMSMMLYWLDILAQCLPPFFH